MINSEESLIEQLEKAKRELAQAQLLISSQDLKLRGYEEKINQLKIYNNLFRTLGLTVDEIEEKADVGNLYMDFISTHKMSWHNLSINALVLFLDLFQKHAEIFADIISQKNSKINIKKTLLERSEAEMKKVEDIRAGRLNELKEARQQLKKIEKKETDGKTKLEKYIEALMQEKFSRAEALALVKSPEFKAVTSMVKSYNITYAKAFEMARLMVSATKKEA